MTMTQRRPRSIEVPGVTHGKTPIPMGARVGNMLFSSGIAGKDPATDQLPADAAAQVRFAFRNMRTLLAQGGASLEDVGRVTVLVNDESVRELINEEWLKCFPDPHDRPARHTTVHALRGGMLVQLELIAVVGTPEAGA
jgi:2-iminobutanoate/2-iminopropanoate deaminase